MSPMYEIHPTLNDGTSKDKTKPSEDSVSRSNLRICVPGMMVALSKYIPEKAGFLSCLSGKE